MRNSSIDNGIFGYTYTLKTLLVLVINCINAAMSVVQIVEIRTVF